MKIIRVDEFESEPKGLLLDVRTPVEHEQIHAPGATLLPLSEVDGESVSELANGRPVYLLCQSGNRARQAAQKLERAGLTSVTVLEGGMKAWEAAGLPVQRGRATISLERQVRIAAGTLVFTGVVLGFFVHPGFYGLSAFVGAGLVFAGITDTCGMGLILARMPWNTRGSCSGQSCKAKSSFHRA